jgi:hypothetical protein
MFVSTGLLRIFGQKLCMNKRPLPKNGLEYLEAFPFTPSVIDVCLLESDEREFALRLAGQMLGGSMDTSFQSHSQSEEKLHHIHFASRIQERIGGQRCAGIGFPLFVYKEDDSIRLAPLFIWRLSLDPDPHRPHFWSLRAVDGYGPTLNPLLFSLFEAEAPLPPLPWQPGQTPSAQAIGDYGKKLAQWLETEWQEEWITPYPVPPLEALGELAEQRVILPCMVMGAFRPAFPAAEAWQMDEKVLEPNAAFEFSHFTPQQATAWERAHTSAYTLIENENDAHTQQWVLNLVNAALANGERCLLVSDRLNRLSRIQAKLDALGLDNLAFLLKDLRQDTYLLNELLKGRSEMEEAPVAFAQNDYNVSLAKSIRYKEKLEQAFQALQKPLLGPYAWTQIVGLYLKSAAIEGKELLSGQLATNDFSFEYEEYEALKAVISGSIPLYKRVNTLRHPLAALHPSRFLEMDKQAALDDIQQKIEYFTNRIESLNHEVLRLSDSYALKLYDYLENGFLALNARLQRAQDLYTDCLTLYGEAFEKTSSSAARLKGIFNKETRAMRDAREEIAELYQALVRRHDENNFFDFPFLSASEARNMPKVRNNLAVFQQALLHWRGQIRDRVQEEAARLNRQTAYQSLEMQDEVVQLEERIDEALSAINETQLYTETLDANMLTIPKKQKFLDSLLEKLETTRLNLRDWDDFYDWQRHWLPLNEPQQRLVRTLIKVKPLNWTAAFESWYFHHCLNRHYSDYLPTGDETLEAYCQELSALQGFLPARIQKVWQERRPKAFKQWKKSQRSGAGAANYWNALLDLFPVWLAPDAQAAAVFHAENCPDLDWVIVWEHQQLEPAFWQALAPKVKRWVVIGGEGGEVWDHLREQGWQVSSIQGKLEGARMELLSINGLYDFTRQTNEAEAQEVLRLLNDIRPKPSRTFPSVAIVTLTEAQRDLISTYLLQIKQRNLQGAEKIRSLERNGLAVMHIDDFLGASFDHILLSLTVGPVNMQGALPNDLSHFSSRKWARALWAAGQSGAAGGQILHSFPDSLLSDARLAPVRYLFHLAVHGKDAEAPTFIDHNDSIFYEELSALLKRYFDGWRMGQAPLQMSRDEYRAAVIADLYLSGEPHTSFTWEWERRKEMKEQGLEIFNAWSSLFWKNPEQEARKLAGQILASQQSSEPE